MQIEASCETCQRCNGSGQVGGTGRDERPWNHFKDIPLRLAVDRVFGLQKPLCCPECGGVGRMDRIAAA